MKPFHYHEDPMYAAAAAILAQETVTEEVAQLDEGVEDIAAAVANFKKGDKTNFGVVTDVSSTSISFKAKDLPVTKIAFNQRKMGSKDFVLDKLVKLKEGVSLEEADVSWDNIDSMLPKNVIDILVGFKVYAKASEYTKTSIEKYISRMKKVKGAGGEAALLKKAFDKISKDKVASKLVDKIKQLPYDSGKDNSEWFERKGLVMQYRMRVSSILSNFESVALNRVYAKSVREAAELEGVELEEGVGDYSVKKTSSSVSKGKEDYEHDVTTTHYDILKDGKKVGNLSTNDFMSGVYGKMYGKDLPDLEGYGASTSSGVLGKLHKFLKSNTGMKWMAKNVKEGAELEEAMGMGTATITAPGNKLHGKQVSIFHKFDDGRLNVQYAKSDKKGDVINLTLKKDQYKLD